MHMSFYFCLTVPTECTVRKVNMYPCVKKRLPQIRNAFALGNRVRRYQCTANRCASHHISAFFIPTANIVEISSIFPPSKNIVHIRFLIFTHQSSTKKRRIPHNIRQLPLRHHALPVQAQGISLYNGGIRL